MMQIKLGNFSNTITCPMNTDKTNLLQWERGQNYLNWCGRKFETKQPLLSVCLLPDNKGIAFVIQFDENTPSEETNAFIIQQKTKSKPVLVHDSDGRLVRMLGCYLSNGTLILKGANNFEYLLDEKFSSVSKKRYYR
jgi:hypothetical protein